MRTTLIAPALLVGLAGCSSSYESNADAGPVLLGEIRVIKLEYATPEEVATALEQLLPDDDSIRVATSAEINSILLSARNADDIETLLDLVARLDVPR